jgi:photosystem II stability/assembly factor-like uncharacterized protein
MRLKAVFQFLFLLMAPFYFLGCKQKCHDVTPIVPPPVKDNLIKGWKTVTIPYSGDLLRLDFPTSSTGYICGLGGIILKTTDEGFTFSKLKSGTTQDLYDIDFVNANIGYAGGNGNTLLKTIDGGQTWTSLSIGSITIRGIYFIDTNIGFVCGAAGSLKKTTDGGVTWITLNSGTSVNDIVQISFTDLNIGYISGRDGYIAKTTNGGQTWNQLNTGVTFTGISNLHGLCFIDNNSGFASGGNVESTESYILKTSDGGTSWLRLSPQYNGVSYTDIQFSDSLTGYAVGGYANNNSLGYIIKTSDGGITWSTIYISPSSRLFGLRLVNSGLAFAVGFNTTIVKGD